MCGIAGSVAPFLPSPPLPLFLAMTALLLSLLTPLPSQGCQIAEREKKKGRQRTSGSNSWPFPCTFPSQIFGSDIFGRGFPKGQIGNPAPPPFPSFLPAAGTRRLGSLLLRIWPFPSPSISLRCVLGGGGKGGSRA